MKEGRVRRDVGIDLRDLGENIPDNLLFRRNEAPQEKDDLDRNGVVELRGPHLTTNDTEPGKASRGGTSNSVAFSETLLGAGGPAPAAATDVTLYYKDVNALTQANCDTSTAFVTDRGALSADGA